MDFKFIFVSLIFYQFVDVHGAQTCTLPNSGGEGNCVDLNECTMFSIHFITPDKFQELKTRMASCFHVNSKSICCEKQEGSTLASKVSELEATTALSPPNNQQSPLTMHRNFKLFDNTKCGIPEPLDRVSYGEDAGFLQNPWAVRIGYADRLNSISHNCGGTLITDRYVLTAAHCITKLPSSKTLHSVILGDYDVDTDPDCNPNDVSFCTDKIQNVLVESSVPHPDYDPVTAINDIGIIRLSEPAKLSQKNIKTICLPFEDNIRRISDRYEVIGWGATENATSHNILQKADLPPYDLAACQTKLSLYSKRGVNLIDGQLCAGGENKTDACRGDSGGSLQSPVILKQARMMQFGVVSYGVKFCGVEVGAPGVYTKVSKYLNWIMDNMS